MYKRPEKKKEALKLAVLYSAMTITVIVVATFLVLGILGYRFDRNTGTLEQSGLVQFASTPSGATIEIEGKAIAPRTPAKSAVEPKTQEFVMWKEGYETWRKSVEVNAGSLVWLNYARLIPKERPVETVSEYRTMANSLASPNKKSILLQTDASRPQLRLVDISSAAPKGVDITVPQELISKPDTSATEAVNGVLALKAWDVDGRYVLATYTRTDESQEWLVLDTRDMAKSRNITREFSVPITNIQFAGTSGNLFYALVGGDIRKLNVSDGTLSRPLVANVEQFSVYDTHVVSYVAKQSESAPRTAGVYREGDAEVTTLHTAKNENATLNVAIAEYFGSNYVAVSENERVSVYKGSYAALSAENAVDPLTSWSLDAPVERLMFSPGKGYVVATAGSQLTSFGLERNTFSDGTIASGTANDLRWLDDMMFWSVVEGKLVSRELDNANVHTIGSAEATQTATLSQNGTYLYSIGKTDAGYSVQRIKMIID